MNEWMDGWMGDLQVYVLLNTILSISGLWMGDNERLWTIEPVFI